MKTLKSMKILKTKLTAMVLLLCVFGISFTQAQNPDPGKWYVLKNRDSGLNMRNQDCKITLETGIELYDGTADCAHWRFIPNNGVWTIKNKVSGLNIRHDGESVQSDVTLAELWDTNFPRTHFNVIDAGGGYVHLQHAGSGLNLRNNNCEGVSDQTPIEFYDGTGYCAQWELIPVADVKMAQTLLGADPELRYWDGNYYMFITNRGGKVRCVRPYDNNNLKGTWYETTAYQLPSWMEAGWAPAVVKVGNEYRMYLTGYDTRNSDPRVIYLLTSNNPASGYVLQNIVIPGGAGGCPDITDAAIDGNYIYYGGALGGGCYMADLSNNGRTASNFRQATGLTNFSEGAFVGNVPGIGKVMLYARGFYDQYSYGTNWATGGPENWTYQGQVNFPEADQYLFALGHASTANGWIAVNSRRHAPGSTGRYVAIGQLSLNGGTLEGARLTEDFTDLNVVAEFGEVKTGDLAVYPNPIEDEFYIAFNATQDSPAVEISMYEMTGKMVHQVVEENITSGINSFQLDRSGITAGNYLIKVISSNGEELGNSKLILK